MLRLDEYRNEDFPAFFELIREWDRNYPFVESTVRESIRNFLQHGEGKIWIAWRDELIVGYAQTAVRYDLCFAPYLELVQLLVAEKERSTGIGGALLEEAEKQAAAAGINTLKLHSQIQRTRAHIFYENHGYSCFKVSKFYEKVLAKPATFL